MYTRKEKQKPFRPSASYKALLQPVPRFVKQEQIDPEDDYRVKAAKLKKRDFTNMVDAETGEPLNYTNATWSAKEGRLSLTAKTIIDMGTGRLDISNPNRAKNGTTAATASLAQTKPKRHELIDRFLTEGPLTPIFHQHWNPLNDSIEDPDMQKPGLLQPADIPSTASVDNASLFINPPTPSPPSAHDDDDQTNTSHHSVQVAERFEIPVDIGGALFLFH